VLDLVRLNQTTVVESLLVKRLDRKSTCNRQTKMTGVEGQVSMANARRYMLYKQLHFETSKF
jgi:hypothetical protein